jgi:hypothetical protein
LNPVTARRARQVTGAYPGFVATRDLGQHKSLRGRADECALLDDFQERSVA